MKNFVIILLFCNFFAPGQSKCEEGWSEFDNEKCYKILDFLVTKENAALVCNGQPIADKPTLLEIRSAAEQAFVKAFIFEQSQVFDSVWLGITRYNATNFQGSNGGLVYSNWLNGSPSSNLNNNCAQLSSGISKKQERAESGSWTDVPCSKRNLVVCQTTSTISLKELIDVVYEMKNNPTVPIGFVYTEYPKKSTPQEIWPSLIWKDVTSEYAGKFFRAEGGNSADFGASQSDNAPRLISVQESGQESSYTSNITLPVGELSTYVKTGFFTSGTQYAKEGLRFETSGGEVRPINLAVRIWERVA